MSTRVTRTARRSVSVGLILKRENKLFWMAFSVEGDVRRLFMGEHRTKVNSFNAMKSLDGRIPDDLSSIAPIN